MLIYNVKSLLAISTEEAGKLEGIGPWGMEGNTDDPITPFAGVISTAIGLMTLIAVIYFIFILVTGGISLIGAGSDKTALEQARKKITNGLIGLIVTVSAMFIIGLVTKLLGFPDFLDIGQRIKDIKP